MIYMGFLRIIISPRCVMLKWNEDFIIVHTSFFVCGRLFSLALIFIENIVLRPLVYSVTLKHSLTNAHTLFSTQSQNSGQCPFLSNWFILFVVGESGMTLHPSAQLCFGTSSNPRLNPSWALIAISPSTSIKSDLTPLPGGECSHRDM